MRDDVVFISRDGKMRDIIFDTDCETSPGLFSIEKIKDTLDVLRSCILAGDTISAA